MFQHVSRRSATLTSVFVLALAAAHAHAAGDECKPVFDAIDKQLATPTHAEMTRVSETPGNAPETSESITVDNAIYVLVKGEWRRSEMTPKDMQEQQQQNRKNTGSYSCKYLREEPVDGEATAVYAVKSTREDAKSDGEIWVSKTRGLPLKQDAKMDMGAPIGKISMAIRYDYTNIKAPAGAK